VCVVPYPVTRTLEAIANETVVFIVEGERTSTTSLKLGIVATCNAGGANKWHHDTPLTSKAPMSSSSPTMMTRAGSTPRGLPFRWQPRARVAPDASDLPPKGDISNWIEAGGTAEQLWALVEQAPDWKPQ
jgi:hypothetical protein